MSAAPGSGGLAPRVRRPLGIPLGRIGGIPIVLAPSWLIAVVVIVVLATPVVDQVVTGITTVGAIAVSTVLAILLGASVLAHELGHCLAARSFGLPVTAVRLYLIGGVSELGRAPASPKEEALIAGAGPGVSALLAVVCGLLVGSTDARTVAWLLLIQLALSNGVIAVFNILPALPLDGGRVLRAGVWKLAGRRRAGTIAAVVGGFVVAAALLVWAAVELSRGGGSSLLLADIGAVTAAFVAGGAFAEWPSKPDRGWPADVTVASLAHPIVHLPGETPIATALSIAAGRPILLTGADAAAAGIVDAAAATGLALQSPAAPAAWAARALEPGAVLLPGDQPSQVVDRLGQVGASQFVLVDDAGRPAGVVFRSDILRVLSARRTPRRPTPAQPAGGR
jgi:Zn-dependent protease/CBS domain-containing protein